jgi:hypothetical protein
MIDPIITVIILLVGFGIKHFICDFLLQFDYMIREKGRYCAVGGLHHSALHGFFTFVVLVPYAPTIALHAAFVDFVVHYHIDWSKQQLNKGLTPADRKFWIWLGLDQALHYLTYVGFILLWYLSR